MSFAAPIGLLLLVLLVPGAAWLVKRRERERRAALRSFGDPALLGRGSVMADDRTMALRAGLQVAALAFGLLALARPELGEKRAELARQGRDVLLALDLSRSMTVQDVSPSRLAVAKRAAWETIYAHPGDRVGFLVFGGSAFLQLPLTSDQAALRLFLDAATPDDLGDPATDIPTALATAAKVFEHEGERGHRAVLIVSDGESGEGDLDDALAALRKAQIPVFALAIGTRAGGPVPADSSEAPERFHRDHIGRIAVSRMEEGELRRAAEATGGAFARWDQPAQRRGLTAALGKLESRTLAAQQSRQRADRFQWPLALAVLALLGELALRARPRRRHTISLGKQAVAATLVLLAVGSAACGRGFLEARRGEQRYEAGDFAGAAAAFDRALAADSTPARAYNSGNALYRLRRYEDAARRYRMAAESKELRQPSLYNLGNSLVRAAEEAPGRPEPLREAIRAYEEALRLDPGDAAAKWNLELAVKRLTEDRTSGGSPGRGRNADYGRGNMNNPGYEGNPEAAVGAMAGGGFGAAEGETAKELNEDQARRLLETVQRQQLTSHEGRPPKSGATGERDW
jgi:Ca-activated chloride channel family protein